MLKSHGGSTKTTLDIDEISLGNRTQTLRYDSIAMQSQTILRGNFQSLSEDLPLSIDVNGDSTNVMEAKPSSVQMNLSVSPRWNLISLPVGVLDSSRHRFIKCNLQRLRIQPRWICNREFDIITGMGYWLKFNSSQTYLLMAYLVWSYNYRDDWMESHRFTKFATSGFINHEQSSRNGYK